jgi:hypothetical protein
VSIGASALDLIEPAAQWEAVAATAASAVARILDVAVDLPARIIDVRPRRFATPHAVARPAAISTGGFVQALVAWEAQLVEPQAADFYEWASIEPVVGIAAEIARRLELSALGRSSMRRIRTTPEYATLLELGEVGISIALGRLNGQSRPLWLAFLRDAVHDRPAEGTETIDEAAAAWRDWGRRTGHLA